MECMSAFVEAHFFLLTTAKLIEVIIVRVVFIEPLLVNETTPTSLAHNLGFFNVRFDLFIQILFADVALAVPEENACAILKMAVGKRGNNLLLSTPVGVSEHNGLAIYFSKN